MADARGQVHLVGSVGLADAEAVFRTLGESVGARARRYPDGETGKRGYWIRWQVEVLEDHPQFELAEAAAKLPGFKDTVTRPFFRVRDGIDPAALGFARLGYAGHAIASYQDFARLKAFGAVPETTRFQVSLPTPVAFVTGFIVMEDRLAVEAAYQAAMTRELVEIAAAIPAAELAIQWDVCHEVIGHDGYPIHYEDKLGGALERIECLSAAVPEPVELGFHLCYGDPGHKHVIEPESTATTVAFANGIARRVSRSVQWIHLPVPRDRDDAPYYEPLAGLDLRPETELYLGLVHFTGGVEGTLRRARVAEGYVQGFGIATECGFGRRDPATVPGLLRIHAQVAERLAA